MDLVYIMQIQNFIKIHPRVNSSSGGVTTLVSRVETYLCFLETLSSLLSSDSSVKDKLSISCTVNSIPQNNQFWQVQNCLLVTRAARFVTGNYKYETGSMTGILGQLKWESLKKRRKDNRLILLYKGLKGKASIPTDDLIPQIGHGRNQHSNVFQTPIANTDIYKCSFFPRNVLPVTNFPNHRS